VIKVVVCWVGLWVCVAARKSDIVCVYVCGVCMHMYISEHVHVCVCVRVCSCYCMCVVRKKFLCLLLRGL
jgi:hypothetical protein